MLQSDEDPDYLKGAAPLKVFRKTKPTDLLRIEKELVAPLEHTLYLKLPKALKTGKKYKIAFIPAKFAEQTFTYEPEKMRSEAVHISHIGFRPDDPVKIAFVSLWMGSGGPLDIREGIKFQVLEDKSGQSVFTGKVMLSKSLKDKNEDAYLKNYNGTNVYMLDFSSFAKPGMYRIYVEGIGCSYPFQIEDSVWQKAFYVSIRGLYHQRSGIEIGQPYTTFKRPRCFNPNDGVKVYASTVPITDTELGFGSEAAKTSIMRGKTSEIVPNAWGGYCDAGDWIRRTQHLDAANMIIELYEMFPDYFRQLQLNIPRGNQPLPDILREALWSIDFFKRLQTSKGGIRGGIESAGHPRFGEASWQESQAVSAYAPDCWSSFTYGGAAARAARLLKSGYPDLSSAYRASAAIAFEWAESEFKKLRPSEYPYQFTDSYNLAAAELYRLTGDKKYHDAFVKTTVFIKEGANIYKHKSHDQGDAAWVYINTVGNEVDKKIKTNCQNAIIREADKRVVDQQNAGFRWMKDPYRPGYAGAFSTPDCTAMIRAHALTGKREYLQAIVLAVQTGAGANPLNISYTTGVGHKYPRHALHVDSRVSGQEPPPGLTVFGPVDTQWIGGFNNPEHMQAGKFCYPDVKEWPILETYWDVFWYPVMCEFTIHQSIVPNAYAWGYLAARKKK